MSQRVLFLSRDGGSVQALVPVVHALSGGGATLQPAVVSMAVSRPVLDANAIAHEPLDERGFAADPAGCIGDLLERYRPTLVVSGSSPARGPAPETPEQHAVIESRRKGIPTLGILDTWLLYRERLGSDPRAARADLDLVPDMLCVLDRICFDQLLDFGIPASRMRVTHNPWLDGVFRAAAAPVLRSPALRNAGSNFLFVSQPLQEMQAVRHWPFTQHELFAALVEALPPVSMTEPHRILVWVHPSERDERWRGMMRPARRDVEAMVVGERGASILAHVDAVVSSHSTVAYEALHHATPCISLRPGGENLEKLMSDEVGLSTPFHDMAEFRLFMGATSHVQRRAELRRRRAELLHEKIFFTDGQATARVVSEVQSMGAQAVLRRG